MINELPIMLEEYISMVPGGELGITLVSSAVLSALFYSVVMALFSTAKMLTKKTKTRLDDYLISGLRRPLKILSILLAVFISMQTFYAGFMLFEYSTSTVFTLLFILAATYAVDKTFAAFMRWYGEEVAPKTDSKFDDEIFPLFAKIGRSLIYIFGIIVLLGQMGIEITAFVAALGVGSLAIALALQETLANFFAGVHLLADRPVRPGDYIKLDGTEVIGTIEEVGWRSTRIRTWDNNIVYIPNSKMAQSIIINYFNPNSEMGYAMSFTASYEDEPDKVIDALWEALRAAAKKTGKVVNLDESVIRTNSFLDSAVEYKVVVKIPVYGDRFALQGELTRQVYYTFAKKGISIPFPTRTLYMEGSDAKPAKKTMKMKKGGKRPA
ncbi:mechanosensitive ion channel family protein [Candidatus Micrarchaeota archaeon]|nr:mechanosensitive ion channel family protein [Candidatus Micrarchaeota archaeon]